MTFPPTAPTAGSKAGFLALSQVVGIRHATRRHSVGVDAPWHFLNFLPLPHGQASFRPTPENRAASVAARIAGISAGARFWRRRSDIMRIGGSMWLKKILYPAHR